MQTTQLIDAEVRSKFPGLSDAEILDFFELSKKAEEIENSLPTILATDLELAMVVREFGWDGLRAYLTASVGTSELDANDILSIMNACRFLRANEKAELYAAIYGSASEASSKKTVTARQKGLKMLTDSINSFRLSKEV